MALSSFSSLFRASRHGSKRLPTRPSLVKAHQHLFRGSNEVAQNLCRVTQNRGFCPACYIMKRRKVPRHNSSYNWYTNLIVRNVPLTGTSTHRTSSLDHSLDFLKAEQLQYIKCCMLFQEVSIQTILSSLKHYGEISSSSPQKQALLTIAPCWRLNPYWQNEHWEIHVTGPLGRKGVTGWPPGIQNCHK